MVSYHIKKQREKMQNDFSILILSIKRFEKYPNKITKKEVLFRIRKFNNTKNTLTKYVKDIMVIEK